MKRIFSAHPIFLISLLACISILLLAGCSDSPSNAIRPAQNQANANNLASASSPVKKAQAALDFEVTPVEFRNKYNTLVNMPEGMKNHDLSLPPIVVTNGTPTDQFTVDFPKSTAFIVGNVSKQTGKISDLTLGFAATTDDDDKLPTDELLMVFTAAVSSASGLQDDNGLHSAVIELLTASLIQANAPEAVPQTRIIGDYRLEGICTESVISLNLTRVR